MNKVRALLQAVGFLTLGLLAIYGALAFAGGAGPLPGALSAQAQEALPNPALAGTELVTGTLAAAPDAVNATGGPATINYQGFARENGVLVNGTHQVTARIWDKATGGTELYKTTADATFVNGLFNILLGVTEPEKLAAALSVSPRYIGIDLVDLGSGELIPRQKVHTVPWAMTASTLVEGAGVGNFSAAHINATGLNAGDVWANNYYGEIVNVNRAVRMPRTYATFGLDAQKYKTEQKPMGQWDFCFLTGNYAGGAAWGAEPNFEGTMCHVIMDDLPGWYADHTPFVVNQNERKSWTLWARCGEKAQTARCQAMCINFGGQ